MKKPLALLLALALTLCLTPGALAAEALPVRWLDCGSAYWWDYEAGLLQYEKDGKLGLMRADGTPLTAAEFDELWYGGVVDGGIPVRKGDKWGKIDAATGAVTVPFRYKTGQETYAPVDAEIVGAEGGPYAVATLDGAALSAYKYWDYAPFCYGLAAVFTAAGWGYVDEHGAEVIPCRYYCGGVEDFGSDGYAWVNSPEGYNIIDRTGREVFDSPKGRLLAERPWRAGHGLWGFYGEGGLVGFVDADSGEVVIAPQFRLEANPKGIRSGGTFNAAGYASVRSADGTPVAIDLRGNLVDITLAAPDGTLLWEHNGGLHSFWDNDKFGYMDEADSVVVPAVFDYASDFWDGAALVMQDGKYGILSDPRVPSFRDVASGAWYAPYVDYVARSGIMVGNGDGSFAPEKELTNAECLTLALRLYDLVRGGDGALEPTPEDWGWITFTTADGTVTACGEGMLQWLVFSRAGGYYPAIKLLTPEADAWGQSLDYTEMTMAFDGESWTGTAHYANVDEGIGYLYIVFDPVEKGPTQERWFEIWNAYFALGRWYRDSYWNTQRLGLQEDPAFRELYGVGFSNYQLTPEICTRLRFACALAVAAGEMDKLNEVTAIPDMTREDGGPVWAPEKNDPVYALYEAGILNGVDAEGSFAPYKTLTRAEAAAMAARVLDPALRLK